MASCELLYEKVQPRIFATIKALHKMRYYIDNTEMEIGWLGYVSKLEDNQYLIEDVFLLKQQVHSTTTEIDPDALATMATELIRQGEEGIAKYNKIRLWGHSHVNMSTGASKQDDDQMNEFATTDFYIRLIGNKHGDWNVCLYDYANNVLWSELPLELWYEVDVTNEELDKEIADNVSKKEYTTTKPIPRYNKYLDNYDRYYDDYYDYAYSTNTKGQADRLREEEEKKEKEETPYEIDGELTKEDIRNMKRYYASDEDTCLFMCTALPQEVIQTIHEDYGITFTDEQAEDFMNAMLSIWSNRYAGKYEEGEN